MFAKIVFILFYSGNQAFERGDIFTILFGYFKKLVFLPSQFKIARSSNGRTSVFGTDYVGSNPARATTKPSQQS
jgi:hypothetical protein